MARAAASARSTPARNCKISFEELEPRTFSFNSPYGACPTCEGLGSRVEFDPELVVPDDSLSLADGAIAPWKGAAAGRKTQQHQARTAPTFSTRRWHRLEYAARRTASRKAREQLLHGDGKEFPRLLTLLEKEYATATARRATRAAGGVPRRGASARRAAGRGCGPRPARAAFGGKAIHEITALDRQPGGASSSPRLKFSRQTIEPIAQPIVGEIAKRLDFWRQVGLDYLTLDRPADTLSGGELQRVRLATGIGSGLVGVCYVLDEPSIGLHRATTSG